MAVDVIKNVAVKGVAAAVPPLIKRAEDYNDVIGEDAVKKFVDTVGIRQWHVGDGKIMTSDLCYAAAERLINEQGTDRSEIDALIVVTQTGDYIAPSTACVLQERLGLSMDCMAYDISMGCSGYVYGLYNAASHIQNGLVKRVLLLVGDSLSYMASPHDRGQMMLAADAGTATLLEHDEAASDMKFMFRTIGSGYKNLIVPYGGYKHKYGSREQIEREDGIIRSDYDTFMDGTEVFKFSVGEVPKLFKDFFACYGETAEAYDHVVMHQANLFIMKNIAKRLKIPFDKVPVSLDRYGNTSSATIPVTLCDMFGKDGTCESRRVLLAGFGVGLSLGIVSLGVKPDACIPVIISDCTFDDEIEKLHSAVSDLVKK